MPAAVADHIYLIWLERECGAQLVLNQLTLGAGDVDDAIKALELKEF